MSSIVITSAKRTPTGSFQGGLSPLTATDLGAHVLKAICGDSKLGTHDVDDVLMGCVLPAGLGQAPARQATLNAGLNEQTRSLTLNKVCGSGLKSVMLGFDMLRLEQAKIVIAGGMESMTNAPYLMPGARSGYRFGTKQVLDHMMFDGLEDSFSNGSAMGLLADQMAEERKITREQQDNFAIASGKKALSAQEKGYFTSEIAPITLKSKKGDVIISMDEPPQKVRFDKIPTLKPVFRKEGTLTAANSSSLSDGASAVCLMSEQEALSRDLRPRARIVGHASHSQAPKYFTLAPVNAMRKLMDKLGWTPKDIDLFEINEAFACVPLAAMQDLTIPEEKVNIHGGACALGHPIGASGTRLLVTLLHALEIHNLRRGIVSLCIGGGEAVALAIERN